MKTGTGVKFKEFLQYLVDRGRDAANKHWKNIHDLCNPCLVQYDFVAKLETIEQDSQCILNRLSNKTTVEFPDRTSGPNTETHHNSTELLRKYYSTVSEDVIDEIRKVYSMDFKLFGYKSK